MKLEKKAKARKAAGLKETTTDLKDSIVSPTLTYVVFFD
jgi:hypothetical protein